MLRALHWQREFDVDEIVEAMRDLDVSDPESIRTWILHGCSAERVQ